jgi:hypothetical protein
MSGQGMSEVGQLNAISLQKGGGTPKVETPPPTARTISWKLNPVWTVGDIIKATDITVSAGPANAVQTAPALVAQTKGGITVDVTAEAPADGGFARATKTETVTVNKIKPTIAWKTPMPVKKGHLLGTEQQDATITPGGLTMTYAPAAGQEMKTAGKIPLKVSFAGNDGHETATASVELTVVENDDALASARGQIGMESGRGFKFRTKATDPTHGEHVQGALDKWNNSDTNDPLSMKMQGKKIMSDIQKMKPTQLISYMNDLVKDGKGDYKLADTKADGKKAEYPNMIWILPNGLQIRYKPRGDGKDGLTDPMFCVEGRRTDVTTFGGEPEESAFKLMANGEPAPIGPSDTSLPSFGTDTASKTLDRKAMDAACKMTHLYSPVENQVVTWRSTSITFAKGGALTTAHLNATALGGAVAHYVITNYQVPKSKKGPPYSGEKIKVGDILAEGTRTVEARFDPFGDYKSGKSTPVDIVVTAT